MILARHQMRLTETDDLLGTSRALDWIGDQRGFAGNGKTGKRIEPAFALGRNDRQHSGRLLDVTSPSPARPAARQPARPSPLQPISFSPEPGSCGSTAMRQPGLRFGSSRFEELDEAGWLLPKTSSAFYFASPHVATIRIRAAATRSPVDHVMDTFD